MLKNAIFFEKKTEKLPQGWGLRPQTPVGLQRLRAPPQIPELLLPSPVTVTFLKAFFALHVFLFISIWNFGFRLGYA